MVKDKQELLNRAKEHCFFAGLNDCGAEMCRANSIYGIAAIQYIQESLGMKPDASFMTTPDMTITRNTTRWQSGFGYGGKICWGNGSDELIILNTKPNACGMIVGGLEKLPEASYLLQRLHNMEADEYYIDGTKVQWDFYKSNHFVDLFVVKPTIKLEKELPPYAFIIHGSAGEFTKDNPSGFGLYFDGSEELRKIAETIETPFGTYHILTGERAARYMKFYREVEEYAKKKREAAAKKLFGDFTPISNETHQGLLNLNELLLGCNYIRNEKTFLPVTLRGDLPAYLVKGKPSLSPECIEFLGFEKRALKTGMYERLSNLNILPHGGGYNLPDTLGVNRVIEIDNKRYFEMEMLNDRGKKIISEVQSIPFEYRGRNVILRSLELGLFEIAAKLIPQYVLKI